jgi:hypothetical protein
MYGVRGMVFPFGYAFEHFMIDPITYWGRFFDPRTFIIFNIANMMNEDSDQQEKKSREKETDVKEIEVKEIGTKVITRDDLEHLIISGLQSLKEKDSQSYDQFFDWFLQSLKEKDPEAYDQFFDWLKEVIIIK